MLTIPIERKTAFHWQDFDLLGNLVDDPGNFSVHADSPHKTLKDLVAFAKANPGAVTYGTTGIGSDDHISALMLERAAGIKMTHVPFKARPRCTTASSASRYRGRDEHRRGAAVRQGRQRRPPARPDEHWPLDPGARRATFKEQGYDIVMASLLGIAAPKGLPPALREQLAAAVQKAAADPEFQAKAAGFFSPLRYLPPPAYAAELKDAEAGFKQLWQAMPWARSSQPAGRPPSARRLRRRQLGPRVLDHQLRPIDEIGGLRFRA